MIGVNCSPGRSLMKDEVKWYVNDYDFGCHVFSKMQASTSVVKMLEDFRPLDYKQKSIKNNFKKRYI